MTGAGGGGLELGLDGGEQVSTGVGLANIRERQVQAYGEAHRFETYEPAEGGFGVAIEFPFELREVAPPVFQQPTGRTPAYAFQTASQNANA